MASESGTTEQKPILRWETADNTSLGHLVPLRSDTSICGMVLQQPRPLTFESRCANCRAKRGDQVEPEVVSG